MSDQRGAKRRFYIDSLAHRADIALIANSLFLISDDISAECTVCLIGDITGNGTINGTSSYDEELTGFPTNYYLYHGYVSSAQIEERSDERKASIEVASLLLSRFAPRKCSVPLALSLTHYTQDCYAKAQWASCVNEMDKVDAMGLACGGYSDYDLEWIQNNATGTTCLMREATATNVSDQCTTCLLYAMMD